MEDTQMFRTVLQDGITPVDVMIPHSVAGQAVAMVVDLKEGGVAVVLAGGATCFAMVDGEGAVVDNFCQMCASVNTATGYLNAFYPGWSRRA